MSGMYIIKVRGENGQTQTMAVREGAFVSLAPGQKVVSIQDDSALSGVGTAASTEVSKEGQEKSTTVSDVDSAKAESPGVDVDVQQTPGGEAQILTIHSGQAVAAVKVFVPEQPAADEGAESEAFATLPYDGETKLDQSGLVKSLTPEELARETLAVDYSLNEPVTPENYHYVARGEGRYGEKTILNHVKTADDFRVEAVPDELESRLDHLTGIALAKTSGIGRAATKSSSESVITDITYQQPLGNQADEDTSGGTGVAANKAPVHNIPGLQNVNEDSELIFNDANGNKISISDSDAGTNPVKVTLTATNGRMDLSQDTGLSFNNGDGIDDESMEFTGTIANINSALNGMKFRGNADFNGAASIRIQTDDQGNSGSGGAQTDDDTVNITVNAVNDAPSDMSLSVTEVADNADTSSAYTIGTLSATDVDEGDTHTFTIIGGADQNDFQVSTSSLQFKAGTVLDYDTKNSYEVTIQTADPERGTYDETFDIGIASAPTVKLNVPNTALDFAGDSTANYLINSSYDAMPANAITIEMWLKGDPEFTSNNGTPLSYAGDETNELIVFDNGENFFINGTSYFSGAVVNDGNWHHLAFTWDGTAGEINVYQDGNLIQTITGASTDPLAAGGHLVLGQEQDAFGGGFQTQQAYEGAMRDVRIWDNVRTQSEVQSNMYKILSGSEEGLASLWLLDEGSGAVAADSTANGEDLTINGTTWLTDVDALDLPTVFNEGNGATNVINVSEQLEVSDSDSANLSSATVTITNLQDGASESLAATTDGTNITADYDSGTGVLTLSGSDTLLNYKAVLDSVTYNNTAATPDTTTRVMAFQLNDGTYDGDSFNQNVYIRPTLNTSEQTLAVNEDATLDIDGIQVTHDDATNVQVFLKVDNGTLNMTDTTGLTFVDGSSNNSSWMSFHGTLADVNNALATLQYTGDSNFNGTDTLESHILGFQNADVNTIGNVHYSATTGHFYEMRAGMHTWADAEAAADALSLDGMGGYLATITSSGEQSFINSTDFGFDQIDRTWLGANDLTAEGTFRWVTGPEGEANGGAGTVLSYTNWAGGEPNDAGTGEDYMMIGTSSGTWNDVDSGAYPKYLVEYGGLSTDSLLENATINVASVADAPTISNLGGDTPSFTEGGGAVAIDEGGDASAVEVDTGIYNNGYLDVARNSGFTANDTLSIAQVGGITLSGDEVLYNGNAIGDIDSANNRDGTGSNGLRIVFDTDNATDAAVSALIQALRFNNSSSDPDETNRVARITLNDGDQTSTNYDVTIGVTAVSDPPVISNLSGDAPAFTEGDAPVAIDVGSNASVSDADTANYDGGYLDIANGSGTADDQLTVADAGLITVVGSEVRYDGVAIGDIDGTDNGVNGNDLRINFDSASADDTAVGALIQAIRYENTSENPGDGTRQLSVTVNDGDEGTSAASTVDVNLTGVNDAATVTDADSYAIDLNGTTSDYLIRSGYADFPTTKLSIEMWVNPDNVGGDDGSLLSYAIGGSDNEFLIFNNAESVFINGSSYGTGITLTDGEWQHVAITWDSDATAFSGELKIYLNGVLESTISTSFNTTDLTPNGTLVIGQEQDSEGGGFSDAQAFDGSVSDIRIWDDIRTDNEISNNLNSTLDPGSETNLVAYYKLDEGSGTTAADSTANGNDLTINGSQWHSLFQEDDVAAVKLFDQNDFTITDVDDTNIESATVTIANLQDAGSETLSTTTTGTNISASYDGGTGVLTLTGTDTLANYENVIRNVTYFNSAEEPDTTTRTIEVVVNDGDDNSATATGSITILGINDAPINTVPGGQTIEQNETLTLNDANSNKISISDTDAASDPVKVTLTATNGTMTLSGTTGLTFTTGDGTADASMVFTGTIADINTALDGMTFDATTNFTGSASIQIETDDQGNNGTGGALTDTDTVSITVDPIAIDTTSEIDGTVGYTFQNSDDIPIVGAVASAGDINNDGYADFIITGEHDDVFGTFGKASGYSSTFASSDIDGSNGFNITFNTAASSGNFSESMDFVGDINGDGFADIIIGEDRNSNNGSNAGAAYVVFGKSDWSTALAIEDLDGSNGFILEGVAAGDRAGFSVSSAGDVNKDGYDDILVSAPQANSGAGDTYLVYGKAAGWAATFELSSLAAGDGSTGTVFNGIAASDNAGESISGGVDINGDGYDDFIIGAEFGDSLASGGGDTYVVFGTDAGLGATFDLSTLDGTNGFTIGGSTVDQNTGFEVAGLSDINGDGFDDVLVTSIASDEGFVVFGKSDWSADATFDLADLDGTNGFKITGDNEDLGYGVGSIGDFNADGYNDFIITNHDNLSGVDAETAYVILGKSSWDASLDVSTLGGTDGFTIANLDLHFGRDLIGFGDHNGDGYDDVIISEDENNHIIFGYDILETTTHAGTSGNDTLTGDASANILVGEQGDDTIDGAGGNDVLVGGTGDDILVFDSADTLKVAGGLGNDDTLRFDGTGQSLDLTSTNNNLYTGIERIDLTGTGNNSVTLSTIDVLDLSDTTNTLYIDGNAGDSVTSSGEGWTDNGTTNIGGTVYHDYTNGDAQLYVDDNITQTIS